MSKEGFASGRAGGTGALLDVGRNVFTEFDQLEQEVQVLTELRQTAEEHFERACAAEEAPGAAPRAGQLWVRVVDAQRKDADEVEGQNVGVILRSGAHTAQTAFRPAAPCVAWNETFPLPVHLDAPHDNFLSLTIVHEAGLAGRPGDSMLEPVPSGLQNQRARHRWCLFPDGWRLHVVFHFIHSPALLLKDHVELFEARLRKARAELLACQKKMEQFIPQEIWNGR
mmetsp:Transcript_5324/g.17135  ORF Transcript_5324/g.17135 Transcript_5324/m.17135 type:complete len:226 (-) Transcript_5324:42-719(-)|eukprot:CAMPEP_0204568550 /NCGR_PEP_ID=MMETSP0661-20131031/37253_1 /ASSEMBLY_ACC=CAM_ASM_000606 /TAXON_ID=109239 /ORGANISM="Alexandrium margalefi, Strain AMGDE01CS-322" /LENGTH=225 /DNA_ID=CAMNT_0051576589 /DNA_START=86 /DNA_END=763 /DNA_ORIENTATION=+